MVYGTIYIVTRLVEVIQREGRIQTSSGYIQFEFLNQVQFVRIRNLIHHPRLLPRSDGIVALVDGPGLAITN